MKVISLAIPILSTICTMTNATVNLATRNLSTTNASKFREYNRGFLQPIYWNFSVEKEAFFWSQFQSARFQFDEVVKKIRNI